MTSFLNEIRERFPEHFAPVEETASGQFTVLVNGSDATEIARHLLTAHQARLGTVFADDRVDAEGVFYLYYVFDRPGDPSWVILKAPVSVENPSFPSLAADLLPSTGRSARFRTGLAWKPPDILIRVAWRCTITGQTCIRYARIFRSTPCCHRLKENGTSIAPRTERASSTSRSSLHADIIEPGHFDFAVAGEPILYLQLRMFYTHKATEKLFEKLPIHRAVFLAESISGDSAFSHGTAFCQAIERAAGIEVPARAQFQRTILLELERIANHISDVGAIANDVGFVIANAHAGRVRELLLGLCETLTGSRLLRGMVAIGGVRRDWQPGHIEAILSTLEVVEREFCDLVAILQSSNSTRERLQRTGILRPEKASMLGVVGVAGRASGVDLDLRRDHPYEAYRHLPFRVPTYQAGDVRHRLLVRIEEVSESIQLIRAAVAQLPDGSHRAPAQPIPPGRCAIGAVEGWRGEIVHWVRTGEDNRLERCKVKDPSINNSPAIVEAVEGNIIADFPVINKSFNLSYSGTNR